MNASKILHQNQHEHLQTARGHEERKSPGQTICFGEGGLEVGSYVFMWHQILDKFEEQMMVVVEDMLKIPKIGIDGYHCSTAVWEPFPGSKQHIKPAFHRCLLSTLYCFCCIFPKRLSVAHMWLPCFFPKKDANNGHVLLWGGVLLREHPSWSQNTASVWISQWWWWWLIASPVPPRCHDFFCFHISNQWLESHAFSQRIGGRCI